jgi:hypothetical protein
MIHNYKGQLKFIMIVLIHLDFFIYSRGIWIEHKYPIKKIVNETGNNGSTINISTMINLVYELTTQNISEIYSTLIEVYYKLIY